MTFPPGYRPRPVVPDRDAEVVAGILRTCDLHDVGFADDTKTWILEDWLGTSFRGGWVVDGPDGSACAFAHMTAADPSSTIDAICPVEPTHRDVLRPPLVRYVEHEARAVAMGEPRLLVTFSETEGAAATVEAEGFSFVRTFWHMQRDADPSFRGMPPPEDVTIRPYRAGDDDRLGWELLMAAFEGHFGMDPVPFDDYRHDVLDSDLWEPSLAAIAELRGRPVGIVTCYVVGTTGWVGDLGVLAEGRGRGIGRALLERGFALLGARGVSHLQLNVDSGNETGATRLYESAGMTVRRSFLCFEKRLVAE